MASDDTRNDISQGPISRDLISRDLAVNVRQPDAPPDATAPNASADPRRRGRLWVSNRVVEKVAEVAAAGVAEVAAPVGRRPHRSHDRRRHDQPRASAQVKAGSARLGMTMSIGYPASVADVVEQVRVRVRQDVAALTGVRVTHLDIEVSALSPMRAAQSLRPNRKR